MPKHKREDLSELPEDLQENAKAVSGLSRVPILRLSIEPESELTRYINECRDNELREQLAALSHEIWAHWMRYQFSVCETSLNGSVYIPVEKIARWTKQIEADYADLTEREKDSDREQADKILKVLRDAGVK